MYKSGLLIAIGLVGVCIPVPSTQTQGKRFVIICIALLLVEVYCADPIAIEEATQAS